MGYLCSTLLAMGVFLGTSGTEGASNDMIMRSLEALTKRVEILEIQQEKTAALLKVCNDKADDIGARVDVLDTNTTELDGRADRVDISLAVLGEQINEVKISTSQLSRWLDEVVSTLEMANLTVSSVNLTLTDVGNSCNETTNNPLNPETTSAPLTEVLPPRDCWDLRTRGETKNGVYLILSPEGNPEEVRCDMTTDGGGWTVFQRRYNGRRSFDMRYRQYAMGFGELTAEFWMGNSLLHQFTMQESQTLRVDICDQDDNAMHATYDSFGIHNYGDCFRLNVSGYHGNAGDALIKGLPNRKSHNHQCFSASDRDRDGASANCGEINHSGWWFSDCFVANLNGQYKGMQWFNWKKGWNKYKGSEMKIRPASAKPSTHGPFRCPVN